MGNRSRIFLFILLNILISAAVTLTVLWLWERAHPRPEVAAVRIDPGMMANPGDTQPLLNPQDEQDVIIEITNEDIDIRIFTIVGAGDIEIEYVQIVNQGQNRADLTAWQLLNESGQQFTFPVFLLNSGGAVKVLSKSGTNTAIELFWQADQPIWQPGETARLINAAGELITSYAIP
jgi:hypothetical protein